MAEPRLYRIICVGDSRLARIQTLLNDNMRNMRFMCYVFPGASLGQIAYQLRLLLEQVSPTHYDYIAVIAGICDLTYLERCPNNKRVSLAYTSIESTVENFERLFALFRTTLRLYTDIPVFYAMVSGMHLNFYSRTDCEELYRQQLVIDTSIPLINIIVKRVSMLNNMPTLDLARFIHRSRGHQGKYKTKYCNLYDGCHPTESTRQAWASEILKTITNYIYEI